MSDVTPPRPEWADRLATAAKGDPEWLGRLVAATAAVREARRVVGEARADEQAAAQRRQGAEQAVDDHVAALADVLTERGTPQP